MRFSGSICRGVGEMRRLLRISIILSATLSATCLAYEPLTHQTMSDVAASQVIPPLLLDWNLKGYADLNQTFPDAEAGANECVYLGPEGSHPDDDCMDYLHKNSIPPLMFVPAGRETIEDLIKSGAALEDEDNRSICHFYDPSDRAGNSSHSLDF